MAQGHYPSRRSWVDFAQHEPLTPRSPLRSGRACTTRSITWGLSLRPIITSDASSVLGTIVDARPTKPWASIVARNWVGDRRHSALARRSMAIVWSLSRAHRSKVSTTKSKTRSSTSSMLSIARLAINVRTERACDAPNKSKWPKQLQQQMESPGVAFIDECRVELAKWQHRSSPTFNVTTSLRRNSRILAPSWPSKSAINEARSGSIRDVRCRNRVKTLHGHADPPIGRITKSSAIPFPDRSIPARLQSRRPP